jgi:hypothetical protein
MEAEGSLQLSTGPYSESDQFNAHHLILTL